jgi:hypothetical protein
MGVLCVLILTSMQVFVTRAALRASARSLDIVRVNEDGLESDATVRTCSVQDGIN